MVQVVQQEVFSLESFTAELTHERSIVSVNCPQMPSEHPFLVLTREGFQADRTGFARLHWERGAFTWTIVLHVILKKV